MMNGIINSGYMPVPPIHDDLVTDDNKMEDIWKNHMDAISQTVALAVAQDRFNDTKQDTPVTTVISMERTRINQLENATNGIILYDTTNNHFIFRQAGAWVTFTPIPG